MEESNTPRRLSRRTIAKGAAWTVPAIAVVSPSPAMAASPGIVTLTGDNCKLPGNAANPYQDGAVYLATITNTTAAPIEIAITSFLRGGAEQDGSQVAVVKLSTQPAGACCVNIGVDVGTTTTFTVPANSSGTYAFVTEDWGASANVAVSVNYTVDGVAQPPATGMEGSTPPFSANTPCSNIGGSCNALTNAQKFCILAAIGVQNCTGGCS